MKSTTVIIGILIAAAYQSEALPTVKMDAAQRLLDFRPNGQREPARAQQRYDYVMKEGHMTEKRVAISR